jgi:hemerythrin
MLNSLREPLLASDSPIDRLPGNAAVWAVKSTEMTMPTIAWDPSMSTGVDSLDNQHKQLIAWLNDLLGAMSVGRGRAEVESLLDKLGGYAMMHFGHEEDCMEQYRCPVAAQNAAAHQAFVATFGAFREEFERTGATAHLVIRLESELMRWLTMHIKRTDTQLLTCVKARASQPGSSGGVVERHHRPSQRHAKGRADGPARPQGADSGGDPHP